MSITTQIYQYIKGEKRKMKQCCSQNFEINYDKVYRSVINIKGSSFGGQPVI